MNERSNILFGVPSLALQLKRKYVTAYSHLKSRQKFTQAQLLPRLVLRAYLKTTYRGVVEFLETSDLLRERLGLEHFPHYSTLK